MNITKSKTNLLALAVAVLATAGCAEKPVHEVRWSELSAAGKLEAGELLAPGHGAEFDVLRITNRSGQPRTYRILVVDAPALDQLQWRVTGQIRYENVEGDGYLDLRNVLPSGTFFTKSILPDGPMGKIHGSSDWRPFILPFDARHGGQPPTKLILHVVLPTNGTVDVGPVAIYDGPAHAAASPRRWWSERTSIWLFSLLGAALGCFGGLLGTLAGVGRARWFVVGSYRVLLVACPIAALAGIAALALSQPYGIYYPLLLVGLIGTIVFWGTYRIVERRYRELELRRMRAMDASM